VIGNDAAVAVAGQGSHFELNTMMPVAGYNLLQSISLLAAGSRNFARQCVRGLTATARGPELVERGLGIATALAPHIGYDAAAAIAKEAASSGETVAEVAKRRTKLGEGELRNILDPLAMVEPGMSKPSGGS
jgi:fumarate hydratase class II